MNSEPISISAAIGGVLSTGVALAAVLWPDRLTPIVTAAIILFGNAVILTGAAIWARAKSTPTAAPTLAVGTPVLVATPAGAPADTPPPDAVVALRSELRGAQPE